MKKILEILKQIWYIICIVVQWTKKFYFFHFVVIFSMPMVAFAMLGLLNMILFNFDSESVGFFQFGLILLLFNSFLAIVLGIILQIICMLITLIFKHTIFVESKFFEHNKVYNIIYLFSLLLIVISRICVYSSQ